MSSIISPTFDLSNEICLISSLMSCFIDSITEYATSDSRSPISRSHNKSSSFSSLMPREGFLPFFIVFSMLFLVCIVCCNSVSMLFSICLSICFSLLRFSFLILFFLASLSALLSRCVSGFGVGGSSFTPSPVGFLTIYCVSTESSTFFSFSLRI